MARPKSTPNPFRWHCQTKCTLTVKGALHIDLEPAAAVAGPCFSWTIRTLLPKNRPQRRKILARCIWSDNALDGFG